MSRGGEDELLSTIANTVIGMITDIMQSEHIILD